MRHSPHTTCLSLPTISPLDQGSGFAVGPSVHRCTRGIWMWGEPRKSKLPSGAPCYVIVLDTEGIGGVESDSQYDARIFSLALLLCSTLIYNSMGSIDESAIGNLSFVAQLSQHIRISKQKDGNDKALGGGEKLDDETSEFHKIFPSFKWVPTHYTEIRLLKPSIFQAQIFCDMLLYFILFFR